MLKLFATTYDYCEHEEFCYEMNDHNIDVNGDILEQLYQIAKQDHASVVAVFEVVEGGYKEIAELYFKEFKCHCEG